MISQGFSGDELLAKFAEMRAGIHAAIVSLIKDADEIAAGKKSCNLERYWNYYVELKCLMN